MNDVSGYSPQEIVASRVTTGPTVNTPTATGTPTPEADQAGILSVPQGKAQPDTTQKIRDMYLSGKKPNVEQTIGFLNELGEDTPSGPVDRSSGKAVNVVQDMDKRMRVVAESMQEIRDKSRENNKKRIRQGLEPIAVEDDSAFMKLNTQLNEFAAKRAQIVVGQADETNAILVANAFKVEAQKSYESAAKFIENTLASVDGLDLDLINENLNGTLQSYGTVDPDHFSLTIDGKQRDITKEELLQFIETHGKKFAFDHTDPVELAKQNLAKLKESQQPTVEALPSWVKKPK